MGILDKAEDACVGQRRLVELLQEVYHEHNWQDDDINPLQDPSIVFGGDNDLLTRIFEELGGFVSTVDVVHFPDIFVVEVFDSLDVVFAVVCSLVILV